MLKQVQHDKKSLDSRLRGNDIKNSLVSSFINYAVHHLIKKVIKWLQPIKMNQITRIC